MIDFLIIATREKNHALEIYPKFRLYPKSKDLMIRGGDFYAVWDEEVGLWSTNEDDASRMIDRELKKHADELAKNYDGKIRVMYMYDSESGSIDAWHRFVQKQSRDSFHTLDENLIFSNTEVKKKDYATKRLNYPLEAGLCPAWDKLVGTLYSEEEREKIEWAIGSIITGDSKSLQKFMVFYGSAGTGKSTVLNIIQMLFDGYYCVFSAKALGSSSNSFALESFKNNPLVAIEHDGDLSRIEDNTRLNSLVSHELMSVNEKFKSAYSNRFKCFLFMGTNKPVKITDAKSGLIRRLIDVSPSGKKLSQSEYKKAMNQIPFELGAIATHCRDVYLSDVYKYDDYMPLSMMGASNDFYNFMVDSYHIFKENDGITMKAAWELYKQYGEDAKLGYSFSKRQFKEELKNYFNEFSERFNMDDGSRVRSYYSGFKEDKFENLLGGEKPEKSFKGWIEFKEQESSLDYICSECPAQYGNSNETPVKKWDDVTTKLSDIDTSELHYVKVPENHIVIDFDIPNEKGEKSLELNLLEANKWPATYAELSKSGKGIHLHYIYTGDVSLLNRVYGDHIEVKVYSGKSSLRRKLTKCNDIPIATINSGLPLKGAKKVVDFESITNEKHLRKMVKKNLNKEVHANTKPSIDFIFKLLEDAYNSGVCYDISDMRNDVIAFAVSSSNQADYCMKLVSKMHFTSLDPSTKVVADDDQIIFYDVEVFKNLFLVNWKVAGEGKPVVRMINPSPSEIEELMHHKLVGFNCRRYDNHILWARMMGYSNLELYNLSQKIISGDKNAFFGEAYNVSYTDVYDFCSKKQSLKKWEIELGIHHQELGLAWDQEVPKELWEKVAEYCDNDVLATEAVFNKRKADFVARQIQVALVKQLHGIDASVNDTTNTLSAKIIFGANRKPQGVFNWRDLSKPVGSDQYEEYRLKFGSDYKFRVFDDYGIPLYRDFIPGEKLPKGWSILPFFRGYTFENGKSFYMGEEIGEGGRVYSEPGFHANVWDGDVTSQHPHSAIFECIFGPEYTKIFQDIVNARVAIKHRDFEEAGKLLNGALKPFLNEDQADDLAQALKIVINSIYGLTSAGFINPFRDPNNIDNIVAKRGALFMTLLKSEVQKRGYTVAHIKTDSIKIPNATKDIMDFVIKFGMEFGYKFETEAEFEKFCLVNDAVYIAKYKEPLTDKKTGEKIWWTATGKQFAVPYVFKKLFSHKDIVFNDLCETFAVSKGDLYLDMNENLVDVTLEEAELERRRSKGKIRDFEQYSDEELQKLIDDGHNLIFVGRVGQFTPIKSGSNGGVLYRVNEGKRYAAPGSTGYRWLESEMVKKLEKEDCIDISFYDNLVNDAVDTIGKFVDFEWFASDDPVHDIPDVNFDLPWVAECGRPTCKTCDKLNRDIDGTNRDGKVIFTCKDGYDVSDLNYAYENGEVMSQINVLPF